LQLTSTLGAAPFADVRFVSTANGETTRTQIVPKLLPEQPLNVWLVIHHEDE
jgi:hypothetical protein